MDIRGHFQERRGYLIDNEGVVGECRGVVVPLWRAIDFATRV